MDHTSVCSLFHVIKYISNDLYVYELTSLYLAKHVWLTGQKLILHKAVQPNAFTIKTIRATSLHFNFFYTFHAFLWRWIWSTPRGRCHGHVLCYPNFFYISTRTGRACQISISSSVSHSTILSTSQSQTHSKQWLCMMRLDYCYKFVCVLLIGVH